MSAREQDKAMAGLLRRGLSGAREGSGADCPGSDVLAAYYDRSLSKAERERCEVHFSVCARCQGQLAALVRAESPAEDRMRAEWLWNWRPAWRLAAPAALAVLVVWLAIHPLSRGPHPATTEVALNRVENPAAPAGSTTERTGTAGKSAAAPLGAIAARKAGTASARDELKSLDKAPGAARVAAPPAVGAAESGKMTKQEAPLVARQVDEFAKVSPAQTRSASGQKDAAAEAVEEKPLVKAAPPAPAVPVQAEAAAPLQTMQAQKESGAVAAGGQVIPALGGRVAEKAGNLTAVRKRALATHLVESPDAAVLWRIGAAGLIARSGDGGKAWQIQTTNASEDLLAGAAPSAKMCWVVGRAGTVLRTTDGEHWKKLTPPAEVDLTEIEARDAQQATVIATNGRMFSTTDGGQTWQAK